MGFAYISSDELFKNHTDEEMDDIGLMILLDIGERDLDENDNIILKEKRLMFEKLKKIKNRLSEDEWQQFLKTIYDD